jgi:aspartate 1-decarboxylase
MRVEFDGEEVAKREGRRVNHGGAEGAKNTQKDSSWNMSTLCVFSANSPTPRYPFEGRSNPHPQTDFGKTQAFRIFSSMEKFRRMLRAKIHRATVTHADLEYEGSLTIPPDLMDMADIREYEGISVWNVTRGSRLDTYAMRGETGSRDIAVNGAAAHLAGVGDKIIISTFSSVPESEIDTFKPILIFVDSQNRAVRTGPEVAGPRKIG